MLHNCKITSLKSRNFDQEISAIKLEYFLESKDPAWGKITVIISAMTILSIFQNYSKHDALLASAGKQ
jgi:hypothetical protein